MPEMPDGSFVLDDTRYKFGSGTSTCPFCVHFHGEEKGTCEAYPAGIPDRFSWKPNRHNVVEKDQVGDFIWKHKERRYTSS